MGNMEPTGARVTLGGGYRMPKDRRPGGSKRQGKHRRGDTQKKLAFAAEHVVGQQHHPHESELDPKLLAHRKEPSKMPGAATSSTPESTVGEETKKWSLTASFVIRPPISLPFLVGWELDDRVMLRDLWSDEVYITNLNDGITREVFVNQLKGDVFHCDVLSDDRMVYCDSRSGLVHICTTSGDHLKTIATTHRPAKHMYCVAVDNKGRIVFGVRDGTVFIIDPQESAIVSSYSVGLKIDRLVTTASGYIVIKSGIAKLIVVRDGTVVHTITDPDWCWASCVAHPSQEKIYVVYSKDNDGSNRRIMTVRPTGEVLKDEVMELGDAPHRFMRPSIIITRSGKIILCDNGQLLVYELKDAR